MATYDSTERPAQRRFDPVLYGSLLLGVVSLFIATWPRTARTATSAAGSSSRSPSS
jgi:hypothetical protein